ncbi:MAG: hypothetical protein JWN23_2608 [Rhodocyclales bacterium]|nr:hypothetical protein [Rhodocyclales bacterium]
MESTVHLKTSSEGYIEAHLQGAKRSAASRHAAAAFLILATPLVGISFASKFAIPGFNIAGVGLGFPLIYLALAWGAYLGDLIVIEWSRLMSFCLMAGVLGTASALNAEKVSVPSIMLLIMLHLPYVFHIQGSERVRETLLKFFLGSALIIALCGIGQFIAQMFLPASYVFPIENFLPDALRVTGFNMQIPLSYGSTVYRANGIFMQEPSFFSQFLAIAILVELMTFNRLWLAVTCAIAVLVSQSGTGLVLLGFGLPLLMVVRRRWDLLAGCLVLLLLLMLASPFLHLDHLIDRVGEFGSTKSSAYERFLGGFYVFRDTLGTDPLKMLFGYGAGSYREVVYNVGGPAAEMALFKIVIEFGVIGAIAYFGFVFFCILSARGPLVLRVVLVLSLFLNGAYNTFAHSLALSLLVWSTSFGVRSVLPDAAERPRPRTTPDDDAEFGPPLPATRF